MALQLAAKEEEIMQFDFDVMEKRETSESSVPLVSKSAEKAFLKLACISIPKYVWSNRYSLTWPHNRYSLKSITSLT